MSNPMNKKPPSQSEVHRPRQVRVFISSTFRDMQEERDYLVKHVFPELRRRCRERQVDFVEVDLRWGVTEEQAERGEVLPICMAEIEKCRPYFIGLLGEQYGWMPDFIDPELIKIQSWLAERKECSVTELEILHGVLNKPEMANRTYFYFRDPAYAEAIPVDRRTDYVSEDEASRNKLAALKKRIKESGLPIRENYSNPETVGKLILEDLWHAIDEEYPKGSELTPLDQEAAEHEAFAESRARVYIGRKEYFDRLNTHIESDDPPLVLLGDSGVGKSALLSNWAIQYRNAHPEAFVFFHFIGSTPQSADYVATIRRIMEEIKRRYDLKEEIPVASEKLREELPMWLARVQDRMVLILDGLNQLEDRDNAPHLGWLPEYFPPNIRAILSTLPGPSQDAIKKRNWVTYRLEGFVPGEQTRMIIEYLDQYRKSLDKKQIERIMAVPQAANPLYLRVLLEELRIFGIYEELDKRIDDYLETLSVFDLYDKILARLEQDYEKEKPGLVKDALSLIWAARRGLSEGELMELLSSGEGLMPRAVWSPLYLAMEDSLVNRSGLLGFFHDYLCQAVHERYIGTEDLEKALHLRLADYFDQRDLDHRKVDELPWQLCEAREWRRLKDSVTNIAIFLRLMTDEKQYELMGYWLAIGARFDMVEAYNASLERYEKTVPSDEALSLSLTRVARFLDLNARYDSAEPLLRRALENSDKVFGPEHPDTATCLNNLAELLRSKGDYDSAEPLHRRALEISEKVLGPEHPDTALSLNNLAALLHNKGDYDDAEPLYRRALEIMENVLGPEHPDTAGSLNNLAELLRSKGDYDGAEPLYRRALEIMEKVLGPEHPDTASSLNNLALLLSNKGDYDGAEPLYRRALEIREKVLGPEHPDTAGSLNNLAELLRSKGDYDGAEPLYRRALEIMEKVLGPEHPDTLDIRRNLRVFYMSFVVVIGFGFFCTAIGIGLGIWSSWLWLLGGPLVLCGIGILLWASIKLPIILEPFYRVTLTIREKILGSDHPRVATSLNSLAARHHSQGSYAKAEPLYKRVLIIHEKIHGPEHPNTVGTLMNLALLLRDMGNYGESALMFKRFIAIFEKKEVADPSILNFLALCHNELAFHTYVPEKSWKKAEHHYQQAINLFSRASNPIESANAELNLQTMYSISGQKVDLERVRELTQLLEKSEDIRAEKGHELLKALT